MNQSPKTYYQNALSNFSTELKAVKKRLFGVAMIRLSIFLITAFWVCYFFDRPNISVVLGITGVGLFLFAVSKSTDIKLKKRRLEKLIELNEQELKVLNRNIKGMDTGEDFITENHFYNQDIDLFGEGSIFQYINRSATQHGREKLAAILNSNSIAQVYEKQEAVKELSQIPDWRQHFQTTAALVKTEVEHDVILKWLKNYKPVFHKIFRFLPLAFSILSVICFTAYGFGWITESVLTIWFFLGLGVTAVHLKKINDLYNSSGKMRETFSQYSKLLQEIEEQDFDAVLLRNLKEGIKTDGKKASEILGVLSGELNNLDQRNNIIFALVANGFFLWDLRYAYRIEAWMAKYRDVTDNWFRTIALFDAYNSLGNYAFNYPAHIYPEIADDEKTIIKSEELGHPLLSKQQRVSNDFEIRREDFFIITGANMAGKSTFLRTVALNLVLANSGLPVCAKSFEYTPIRLISSMRTSDSLVNDESYFFSELKRLKFIVETIKTETYFIILDEILKGTNSKDKEEGSKKFVEKLVSTNSTGIIATHDLSLCQLSEQLPQIKNRYFDAEIVDDELYFDYRFKDGVCQNMNASFLLRKMEIV